MLYPNTLFIENNKIVITKNININSFNFISESISFISTLI